MKYLVTIVLITITTFVVSDAACFFQEAEQNGEPLKGCLYKGKLYPPGKTWRTRTCLNCGCGKNGEMKCCHAYGRPFSHDSNCKFKFDRKACEYVLIPNEDPEKRCTGYGMNYLVAIVLIAGTYLIVCDAGCFYQEAKKGEEPVKGCLYKGKTYKLGESWRTDHCFNCHCGKTGEMQCCQAYGTPYSRDRNCIFKFDRKACEYILIPNEDPKKQCSGYGMVG